MSMLDIRVRTASVKVITLLLDAGADRHALNNDAPTSLTALSVVLMKGAQAMAEEVGPRSGMYWVSRNCMADTPSRLNMLLGTDVITAD